MFGQLVVGPPGCGKSTYCHGISQFYTAIEREHIIVNIDPANDNVPYTANIDISELITLQQAMDEHQLGPNGAMIFCLETLEANIDWLLNRLKGHESKYLLIDCPGQVELFTNHDALRNIVVKLQKLNFRLCVVNLLDAHYCVDPAKYVSMLMVSLRTMLHLESPQLNVLSKIDLMEQYGALHFRLDYYTQVQDLNYLLELLDNDLFAKRYKKLNGALCELVEEFGLVGFLTLAIEDKDSVLHVVRAVDKANGFVYGGLEDGNESIFEVADRWENWDRFNRELGEKYIKNSEMEHQDDPDIKDLAGYMGNIEEHEI
jgi:GTPase SAR1 family protein